RLPRASCEAAASRAMQRCGLTEVSRKLIGTLSKGYQQRVGIAQAIVHEPDLIILDEPTVGLDPNQILDIRTLIRELGRAHSVILSTHILTEVEAVCDRVQILHHGELVFSNTIAGLREFQRGRTVTISLYRAPPIETLRGIEGVSTVDADGDGRFRIRFAPDVDPTATLVARAGAEDWGLHQLTPAQTSLEDVFVHLTRGDSTGGSPS
ncbi:MAG: ATP-binding cassette domain-containing protein, partial [Burkholderiales bacterium]